jgi:hypothetical protein
MTVTWQITELSTKDAAGNYIDDLAVGIEHRLGFALDIFAPGDDPEEVTVATVSATLSRYRHAHELTGPTVARRVVVDDTLVTSLNDDDVTVTIPDDVLQVDQVYQLKIVATDSTGLAWARTREYRAVA